MRRSQEALSAQGDAQTTLLRLDLLLPLLLREALLEGFRHRRASVVLKANVVDVNANGERFLHQRIKKAKEGKKENIPTKAKATPETRKIGLPAQCERLRNRECAFSGRPR